jgi:uncharacterized membrane protein SpoIIM required for sporulation
MTDTTAIANLRSARFRQEREAAWKKLETLVIRVEKSGLKALNYDEARDLATHYRQAMNSLSVARDISLDQALLQYLENLCARGYLAVYAPQESLGGVFARLFLQGIPQAVRRTVVPLLIGFGAMVLGAVVAYVLCAGDPSWYFTFVPQDLSDGRTPGASVEYLRGTIYGDEVNAADELGAFATYLFSHNTQVAILTFALGVFITAPSFILTFYNGLVLGAFYWMFAKAGLGYDIIAWLSVHGVTEISAICIACAGGVQMGLAILMPGALTRRDALRQRSRDAVKLMILAGLMLLVAAFLEGFLRQTVQSAPMRLTIGWGVGAMWLAYFVFAGRDTARPATAPGRTA